MVATSAPGEQTHHLGHEDLAAASRRAQASGLDDWGAEAVRFLEGDIPGAGSDPDLHRHLAHTGPVVAVESLLNRDRGGERIRCAREGGHDPVTEVFDEPSSVRIDGFDDESVVGSAKFVGGVLAEPRP